MVAQVKGLQKLKIQNFEGSVAVNKVSILKLARGPEYHKILFYISDGSGARTKAELATDIEKVVLNIGRKERWELSGANLIAILEFYQANCVSNNNDGILPLYFARHWMESVSETGAVFRNIDGPALGTSGLPVVSIEVHWSATSGATDIEGEFFTGPKPMELGYFIDIKEHQEEFNDIGWKKILSIDPDQATEIVALHLTDDNITDIRFRVDGQDRVDSHIRYLLRELLDAGRTAQAGYTHLDFTLRNRFADILTLAGITGDIELECKFSVAPGVFNIIEERATATPTA